MRVKKNYYRLIYVKQTLYNLQTSLPRKEYDNLKMSFSDRKNLLLKPSNRLLTKQVAILDTLMTLHNKIKDY